MQHTGKSISGSEFMWLENVFVLTKRSAQPIYQQLCEAIKRALREGLLKDNDLLPSINLVSAHFGISRATVEMAYCALRKEGYVGSIPGKAFFIPAKSKYPFGEKNAHPGESGVLMDKLIHADSLFARINSLPRSKRIILERFLSEISG